MARHVIRIDNLEESQEPRLVEIEAKLGRRMADGQAVMLGMAQVRQALNIIVERARVLQKSGAQIQSAKDINIGGDVVRIELNSASRPLLRRLLDRLFG